MATRDIQLDEIRQLMEESQGLVQDRGTHFILWGLVVTAALLANHAFSVGAIGLHPALIWAFALTLGWIGSIVLGMRETRAAYVRSVATRFLTAVWVGCGVTLTILGLVGSTTGALDSNAINAAVASVLGLCYFATSGVYKSQWTRRLAYGWWAGAAALFLLPALPTNLVMAGLIVVLQLVPGVLQYRRAQAA